MKNLLDNVRHLHGRRRDKQVEHATIPTEPWSELPDDPAHPTFENATRYLIARRTQQMRHDATDRYEDIPITATYVNGLGEQIEFGPWSLSVREARELSDSLRDLADELDDQFTPQEHRCD